MLSSKRFHNATLTEHVEILKFLDEMRPELKPYEFPGGVLDSEYLAINFDARTLNSSHIMH